MKTAIALSAALLVPGCVLYTGGDDDPCNDRDYGGGADIAPYELRNPETGVCEDYTRYGGGSDCYGATAGKEAAEPTPDWAMCWADCESMDEATCLEAPACRGIYVGNCPEGAACDLPEEYVFAECWGIAPSGPSQGACEGLDAYQCSLNPDCVARHFPAADGGGLREPPALAVGNYDHCAAEPTDAPDGCYNHGECADGYYCNASEVCEPPPGCPSDGFGVPCEGDCDVPACNVCYGSCVPGEPPDPGSCYGVVDCVSDPPDCPETTMPGIADGCFTGFCIPIENCEPAPACDTLEETACVDRGDCTPYYEGVGCSCDAGGCGCDSWLFSECA